MARGSEAFGLNFTSNIEGAFRLFVTREWHDMLASLFGVQASGHVNAGIHHHRIGSEDGRVHNDLNPGWFAGPPTRDGVTVSDGKFCHYTTGTVAYSGLQPIEVIRAVALIFYLCNPSWRDGQGGETGLYTGPDDRVSEPAVAIPPINNTLVAFECTPVSYHCFISNRVHARNTVIMWLHRPKRDVVARWGANAIREWSE
jgi:hypothetical protein